MDDTEGIVKIYTPSDTEAESAANSYLMSLLVIMVGLPFPIINLIATFFFYLAQKRGSYFVRWHCTQALLSQLPLFVINCVLFWWTVRSVIGWTPLSSLYFSYLFTVVLFNLIDFMATVYTAVQVRKGRQVEWAVFGGLAHLICKR